MISLDKKMSVSGKINLTLYPVYENELLGMTGFDSLCGFMVSM
jgi:hypothetical protein